MAKKSTLPSGAKQQQSASRTVGQLISYLMHDPRKTALTWARRPKNDFLAWPPDAFAVAATVLRESGAYVQVLDNWPPHERQMKGRGKGFVQGVRNVGRTQWRTQAAGKLAAGKSGPIPESVLEWWHHVWKGRDTLVSDVWQDTPLWQSLVSICAAADEASYGMGIPRLPSHYSRSRRQIDMHLLETAMYLLQRSDAGPRTSSLCRDIDPSRAAVLPKMIVPQTGITLRSLSHHLALLPSSEVQVNWTQTLPESADRPV